MGSWVVFQHQFKDTIDEGFLSKIRSREVGHASELYDNEGSRSGQKVVKS